MIAVSKDNIPGLFKDTDDGTRYRVRYIGSPVDCYFTVERFDGNTWHEIDQIDGSKSGGGRINNRKARSRAIQSIKRITGATVETVFKENRYGKRVMCCE